KARAANGSPVLHRYLPSRRDLPDGDAGAGGYPADLPDRQTGFGEARAESISVRLGDGHEQPAGRLRAVEQPDDVGIDGRIVRDAAFRQRLVVATIAIRATGEATIGGVAQCAR